MPIRQTTGAPTTPNSTSTMNPRLPILIPSGRVHVYFVGKNVGKDSVERTTVYYSRPDGTRFKFMARREDVRRDFEELATMKLKEIDEIISWNNGVVDIATVPAGSV